MSMTKQAYFTKIRRYRIKKKAVDLLGGKCKLCGWVGNIGGFQFHHRNPSTKEFGLSNATTTNWEKFWKEAQKCDLICANCHMIHHSDYIGEQFLKDVENYGGRDLISSDIKWKNQTQIPKRFDKICGFCKKKFSTETESKKFCSTKCWSEKNRKCKRPSKEELQMLVFTMSFLAIGRKYNVSDNAIRKWCKSYGIDKHNMKRLSQIETQTIIECGNEKQKTKLFKTVCETFKNKGLKKYQNQPSVKKQHDVLIDQLDKNKL